MLTHDDIVGDIYAERTTDALDIHSCSDNGYSEVDRMVTEYENTIRADERRKFAEWLANGNTFIRRIGTDKLTTIDEVIFEYEKEQKGETE